MSNSDLATRAFTITHPIASASFLEYDHGSAVQCTGFRYGRGTVYSTRWLTGVRVLGSSNGSVYTPIKTLVTGQDQTANGQLSPEYSFATA